jgi:hypothetical protein
VVSSVDKTGFIEKQGDSWVIKNPPYKCQFKEGKCQLKHYPDNIPISCENANKEHCQYRVEDTQEKLT